MQFSEDEKRVMLKIKGVDSTVITWLEQKSKKSGLTQKLPKSLIYRTAKNAKNS
jgi:hypothetical protein